MQPQPSVDSFLAFKVAVAAYAAVLALRFLMLRRGDLRMLGGGLLVAAVGWMMLEAGMEASLPFTLHLPEGLRHIEIPVIRTLAELGAVVAVMSLCMMAISGIVVAVSGSDLIRLQKAVARGVLFLAGLTVIWQAHFVEQFSIRNLLIGAGGALVFIVGLGLQRTMGNLFSGLDLQADQVVRKGDWVQLGTGGPEGVVFDTSLRTTRILTNEGQMMIVANADLLGRSLMNLDQPDRRIRMRRTIPVGQEVPPMRVKDTILAVLHDDPGVVHGVPTMPCEVFVMTYAESSIQYDVRFWVPDRRMADATVDLVMTRIWYALHEAGIETPNPVRAVRMVDMAREAADRAQATADAHAIERQLGACPLFGNAMMSAAERRELARDGTVVALPPGELAVRRGERSDHMFLVLEGAVQVIRDGREPVTIGPSGWFGEVALLRGEPRIADVAAGPEGARLLRMTRPSVLPALARNPSLASELSRVSDARREAAGLVDEAVDRRGFAVRLRSLCRRTLRELLPW